jgi:hypothetical protein
MTPYFGSVPADDTRELEAMIKVHPASRIVKIRCV